MKFIVDWIKRKTIWLLTGLITIFGGITTRLANCTQQTTVAVTQIATNPTNQIATVEVASFVANLFYEGTDDPFATPGAGGEAGKLTHVVLQKGKKLFGDALTKIIGKTDKILNTSRVWDSPQIQKGARAIHKKIGHAEKKKIISAFNGVRHKQGNAEKLIYKIINEADAIVIRPKRTMIYNSTGQGISIGTKAGYFIGFVERQLEKAL